MTQVTLEWSIEMADGTEVTYDIECDVSAPTPDVPYLSNGDPGYPGDPGECEITSIKLQGLGKQKSIEIHERLWNLLGFTKDVLEAIEEKAFERLGEDERDYQERDED